MDYLRILVIINSVALFVFLVLGISLFYKGYKVAKRAERISQHAEEFASKAAETADYFAKTAGAGFVGSIISTIFKAAKKSKKS